MGAAKLCAPALVLQTARVSAGTVTSKTEEDTTFRTSEVRQDEQKKISSTTSFLPIKKKFEQGTGLVYRWILFASGTASRGVCSSRIGAVRHHQFQADGDLESQIRGGLGRGWYSLAVELNAGGLMAGSGALCRWPWAGALRHPSGRWLQRQ